MAEGKGIEPSTLRWHGFQDRLSTLDATLHLFGCRGQNCTADFQFMRLARCYFSTPRHLVPYERIELPSEDYKTTVMPLY